MWPGWKHSPARRHLAWATVGAFALPWLIGEWFKSFHQPGLDNDGPRNQLLIDYIVAGGVVFLLTMVLTYAFGCWITAVMRGPRRDGDAFPGDHGRPPPDD